ncbi:GlsB/YeaQ/YmgE family stress response membrane protein [Sphingomonas sp. SUN039]|uniref:GlsB/YeaQ/YmgE family stress response membrane protein n=1 Tax=Sphingomonas sp. SUN039 TaxID=2937787 RepID=UPI0021648570|nr:GlsB/YeaQ/YmgE family stress response membrane protein [Sphingomonas sp. SUN039]UVO55610.1 GlsB/YeaQ/YmgE family stress response membrane protein [Sphingomonas sp. SUN039]
MSASLMGWILIGLVMGVAGRLVTRTREPGGFVTAILVGIAGALLGGYLGLAFGDFAPAGPVGWVAAGTGAFLLLALYRMIVASRR